MRTNIEDRVSSYIYAHWDKTVRLRKEDQGNFLGLPFPYTVPSMKDFFDEMYYWDTYFTNKGLLLSDRLQQAKYNCDNISYLIEKYGYMPNGNRREFLGRSQPPLFGLMTLDIYNRTKDKNWLAEKYETLKKELGFWEKERNGGALNRYGANNDDRWCEEFYLSMENDMKIPFLKRTA